MSFPSISSRMVPEFSDVGELPDTFKLNLDGDCRYYRIPLGESEDGLWQSFVDVGYNESFNASPCDGICPLNFMVPGYEITAIKVSEPVTVYRTMDPRVARCAIPAESRKLLLEIVDHYYLKLLEDCQPEYIYRFTWLDSPNKKALRKHARATQTLVQAGYSVLKEGTRESGSKFWLLGRNDVDHSNLEAVRIDEEERPGVGL
jgi:hypothetical protein